uniref:Calcitonin related polypeptide beta n=2 Tax=Latimeria chalumnae TaxID=7897 RepID=H3AME0_LATCH
MVLLKVTVLLAFYSLVACQISRSQAAPARPGLESMTDRVTLSDYEARRLLNAMVKEFVQMTAEELEQEVPDGNSLDRPISKRCSNLSTCVLGKLSQELHKLQTYPRTDVGAGTPGKKRNVVNDMERERYANYGGPFESNVTAQKRACNTATCVTHRLADFLSRSGGMGNSNFVPTNVGSKAFGRRRRSAQM